MAVVGSMTTDSTSGAQSHWGRKSLPSRDHIDVSVCDRVSGITAFVVVVVTMVAVPTAGAQQW